MIDGGWLPLLSLSLSPSPSFLCSLHHTIENYYYVFVAVQYTIMPLLGFLGSRLFGLPPAIAAGVGLVACCPGGTASNIVTFLAGADVALSVSMTTASTLGAVLLTPLLTRLVAGALVPVNAWALFRDILTVVIFPVALGVFLNATLPPATKKQASDLAPPVATAVVVLVVSSVIASSRAGVLLAGPPMLGALLLLHGGGFWLGYQASQRAGLPEKAARTNAIEVGMQNSTLGAVLAMTHMGPMAAVPCAVSSVVHSVLGSVLAAYWRRKDAEAAADLAAYQTPKTFWFQKNDA
jgi:bile acid:Na+ symporter, BASS family